MINILIADDHRLFRQTMAEMLSSQPDFNVVSQCENSTEAMQAIRNLQPDIVLMDVNIEPLSGIEATKEIAGFSFSKVIGLSMHARSTIAKKMLLSGAAGYVTKNSSLEEIFTAVRSVFSGHRYICNEIKNIISDELLLINGPAPATNPLTERELEIANNIGTGLSSKEIATKLNIALKTVEVHRHNILKKLDVKNASRLVDYLHEQGLTGAFK